MCELPNYQVLTFARVYVLLPLCSILSFSLFPLCLLYSLCGAHSYCLLTVTTTTDGAPTTTTDLKMTEFETPPAPPTPPTAIPVSLQIMKSVSLTSTSTDFTVRASLAATMYWVLFRRNARPEPLITMAQVRGTGFYFYE